MNGAGNDGGRDPAPLLTADEATARVRISRRTFDGHVAEGRIAYIAVGLGPKRVRKRFDPVDLDRFLREQRRVEVRPGPPLQGRWRPAGTPAATGIIDFVTLRAERRAARKARRSTG